MRRLVIDEIMKLALEMYDDKDFNGVRSQIKLLQNILFSILATIRPGETLHPGKLEEMDHIRVCLKDLLARKL